MRAHRAFRLRPGARSIRRFATGEDKRCEIDLKHAIFFNARDAVVANRTHGLLARTQMTLFAFMLRNAVRSVDLFRIPTENFIEVGRLVEI